ncbi:hypothetical protein BaRGS_00032793, partial [Batillaria attramentaria]
MKYFGLNLQRSWGRSRRQMVTTYFRPTIGDLPGEYQSVMMSFVRLIHGCWAEDPVACGPNCRRVLRLMKKLNPFQTTGIMDNMLKMMERYSSRLEDVVAERTAQLAEEKRKTGHQAREQPNADYRSCT